MKEKIESPLNSDVIDVRKFSGNSGAALELENVGLSIGNNDILNGIDWKLYPNERWALVGPNGAGKSTLLKALTGTGGKMVNIREGDVTLAKSMRVGYLEQKGVSGSILTVKDEVKSRMERLTAATIEYEAAEARLSQGDTSHDALEKFDKAYREFEDAGGNTIEQKISSVLKGLGFSEDDYDRSCSEFSGGWQMRIALARLLLSDPDVLLLDEPTNHLDKGAKDWLTRYLSQYEGTLLVVSHDSNLLNQAVNSIAEVRGGTIELYKSRNYSQWQLEREERVQRAQAAYEKNQEEIARLQGFVDRFGSKTMGASLAQSKLKTIEKLKESGPIAPVATDGPKAALKLSSPPSGTPKRLITFHNVDLKWNDQLVLEGITMDIERGMRIAVRGPNGAGKSTLLAGISGKLPIENGNVVHGDNLAMGVFTQDLAQDLDQNSRALDVVIDTVRAHDPTISDERVRSVLGALGLRQEKALRLVGHLSGGEKARVALASFVLIPHNLLLLDEPTNHLDKDTIHELVNALTVWHGGAIMIISHDKLFLEHFNPTHVLTVRRGRALLEERGLIDSDWDDQLNSRLVERNVCTKSPINENTTKEEEEEETNSLPLSDEDRKKKYNAPKLILKIEQKIERLATQISEIDHEMIENGRNLDLLRELQSKKDQLEAKSDRLWTELESLDALL